MVHLRISLSLLGKLFFLTLSWFCLATFLMTSINQQKCSFSFHSRNLMQWKSSIISGGSPALPTVPCAWSWVTVILDLSSFFLCDIFQLQIELSPVHLFSLNQLYALQNLYINQVMALNSGRTSSLRTHLYVDVFLDIFSSYCLSPTSSQQRQLEGNPY